MSLFTLGTYSNKKHAINDYVSVNAIDYFSISIVYSHSSYTP
ncbi:hypothetical protein BTTAP_80065 [Brochothrix thermosphacta]|nr:hypothetical protein BTTAP_80065 [Brochothrix thermosphacta]